MDIMERWMSILEGKDEKYSRNGINEREKNPSQDKKRAVMELDLAMKKLEDRVEKFKKKYTKGKMADKWEGYEDIIRIKDDVENIIEYL